MFDCWSGKIPRAMEQLSLFATTTEPAGPRAHAPQQKKPPEWEALAQQLESSSCSPQLENALATKAQYRQINIKFKKYYIIKTFQIFIQSREGKFLKFKNPKSIVIPLWKYIWSHHYKPYIWIPTHSCMRAGEPIQTETLNVIHVHAC